MKLKLAGFIVIASALAFLFPVTSSTPAGALTCYGSPSNWFAGHVTQQNTGKIGVAANILTVPAQDYCSGNSSNFVSVWVMTASAVGEGYAQAGYDSALCGAGGCGSRYTPHYFTQARRAAGYSPETWVGGPAPYNQNQLYWSYSDASCGCARMVIGYIVQASSSTFNPFTAWNGSWSQFLNEASDPADHIFGYSSAPVWFSAMKELPYGGSWSGSLSADTQVNESPYVWGVNPLSTCFDGYRCYTSWAN